MSIARPVFHFTSNPAPPGALFPRPYPIPSRPFLLYHRAPFSPPHREHLMSTPATPSSRQSGILGFIEWLGNKLPDPVFLFIGATALIMVLSTLGTTLGWSVQPQGIRVVTETITAPDGTQKQAPKLDSNKKPVTELYSSGAPIVPRNLLSIDGVYWLLTNAVRNFMNFAPLGVVLVGMFGIGVAERVGLFGAAMRWVATIVPAGALTPTVVFLGVVSNIASDAGYIILPPLAAALYFAFGRPPLAGIAAAFAGVAGGFSANLMIGSTDTLVAGITTLGARTIEPTYTVLATSNWWFLIASTFMLTIVGWAVTALVVEPRLAKQPIDASQSLVPDEPLTPTERKGLSWTFVSILVTLGAITALIAIPGAPLAGPMPAPAPALGIIPNSQYPATAKFQPAPDVTSPAQGPIQGQATLPKNWTIDAAAPDGSARGTFRLAEPTTANGRLEIPTEPRWSNAVVPLILIAFFIPGLVYGLITKSITNASDITKAFTHAMISMAPVLAMSFFAAQFIECFKYTRLDVMLANFGGKLLVSSGMHYSFMLVGVVLLVMVINLLIASMSAKWTALSTILVPMMMMAGISPELTQAAYRVGDSCTNIVTPLNTYMVIILVAMQRYRKDAGVGNLIAMMLPYSICFAIAWTALLLVWCLLNLDLGPNSPLWYTPTYN